MEFYTTSNTARSAVARQAFLLLLVMSFPVLAFLFQGVLSELVFLISVIISLSAHALLGVVQWRHSFQLGRRRSSSFHRAYFIIASLYAVVAVVVFPFYVNYFYFKTYNSIWGYVWAPLYLYVPFMMGVAYFYWGTYRPYLKANNS